MFSVKVCEARNESEVVFEATQVRRVLDAGQGVGEPDIIGRVYCDVPDGKITYDVRGSAPADGSGDITMYVMNRFGATVATYHL